GYKEGDVIQHSMITKSIERAQKKVEENNFGIRKRLLEYDDVMNNQRNVIYGRRNHALFGERLALDIDNAFSFVAESLVGGFRSGYKEGDVIQHSMITKSIERAQKKVEENNFGIRKRLLEYDDVMNNQRNVIYGRRNHALFGERLALDIDNAFSFVAESLVGGF